VVLAAPPEGRPSRLGLIGYVSGRVGGSPFTADR
jgi:hypothetical protein